MERIEELDETSDIQAVVAAVRNRANEIRGNLGPKDLWEERVERADELMEIAERIEAVAKRETVTKRNGLTVASRETQSAVHNAACVCQSAHNAAKVREALSAAGRAAREIQKVTEEADTAEVAISIAEICERALLFPLRNCDVGTPEEQAHRFFVFFHANWAFGAACSDDCPFKDAPDINHCQSGWGQLPYDAAQKGTP